MKIDFNKEDRFYEKIKSEIPKKKDELINFKYKNQKVYRFLDRYKLLFKNGIISEIELARKKKKIDQLIIDYESEISRIERLIFNMKDYLYTYEELELRK